MSANIAAIIEGLRNDPGKLDEWSKQGPDTILKLAQLLQQANDAALARECYLRLPKDLNVLGQLASCEQALGRYEEAEATWRQVIKMSPENASAWFNLGFCCGTREKTEEAIRCYDRVLTIQPAMLQALVNKGAALHALRREDEALKAYEEAVKVAPESAEALSGLGQNYMYRGEYEIARAILEKAFAKNPQHADLLDNLMTVLYQVGDLDAAEAAIEKGFTMKSPSAQFNRATLRLVQGDMKSGAQDYEARFARAEHPPRPFRQPFWQGEDISGKTLLVWGEQGIGDELMFASLLADVRCKKLVLELDERLVPLFKRSFPQADVVGRVKKIEVDAALARREDIDVQISMGSLMRFAKPSREPYLKADAKRVESLTKQYRAVAGEKRRVGISWYSANPLTGQIRTMKLRDWLPILQRPDMEFFDVQYGDHAQEIQTLKRETGIVVHQDKNIDPLKDMDAFAARVKSMDLLISCANSTVHLAGAMGVPVWVMTPFMPSWRWQLKREDSIWYQQVRLFRQQAAGAWSDVIAKVAAAL